MAERSSSSAASLARVRAGVQHAVDEERRRLASSLHDSAMQTLTAATMNLSLAEREAAALSPAGRQALADAEALLEECGRELRALAHALFPALLGSAGLGPALRWLARQKGDRLRLEVPTLPRYGVSVELAAYRLLEEAVAHLYDDDALVTGRVIPAPRNVLEITLEGRPRPGDDRLADLTLRHRVRAAGGRFRARTVAHGLRLEVRFPPSVPDIER